MKELKFKAWLKEKKKFVRVYSLHFSSKEKLFSVTYDDERGGSFLPTKYFELLQFIGEVDKNGKEIYEGDIVKARNGWQAVIDNLSVIQYLQTALKKEKHTIRVIGNIYENPELTK